MGFSELPTPAQSWPYGMADRLRFAHRPGHRPWLLPDPQTEQVLQPARRPLATVAAVIEDLTRHMTELPPEEADWLRTTFSVFVAPDPTQHGSRAEAIATISRVIADKLVRDKKNRRNHATVTVSRFGAGCGILLQDVYTDSGRWYAQECFLIDSEHRSHRYDNFSY